MNLLIIIVVLVILIVIIAVIAGYLTRAATHMRVTSDNEDKAYKALKGMYIADWTAIAVFIILIIILVYFGEEFVLLGAGKYIVYGILIGIVVLFVANWIVAAVAAANMENGPNIDYNRDDYNICKNIAIICGIVVALVVGFIIYKIYSDYKRAKNEREDYVRRVYYAALQQRQQQYEAYVRQQAINRAIASGSIVPTGYSSVYASPPQQA